MYIRRHNDVQTDEQTNEQNLLDKRQTVRETCKNKTEGWAACRQT